MNSDPAEITAKSRSNLAFALGALPEQRRDDMVAFYAFCRVVDDIADDPETPVEEKRVGLAHWREAICSTTFAEEDPLERAVAGLLQRYPIRPELLGDIIDGVEMDLDGALYQTFDQLNEYCYRVAGAVGLVSIEIFGYQDARCKDYAVSLGNALQLTNIMRDVGQDLENEDRIYLPVAELAEFGYSEEALRARTYNESFVRMMDFQRDRTLGFYEEAEKHLPAVDRRNMVAARAMGKIYGKLLTKMDADRYRVFDRRYRVGKLSKVASVIAARFGR